MAKYLEIGYPDKGVTARFELFEERAPKTVAAVWEATSDEYTVPCYHSIFSGQEVFWYVPAPLPDELPLENSTWRCNPGDLFFFEMRAGTLRPRGQTPELQGSKDVFELAVVYGLSDFMIMTLDGWRGAVIGRIEEDGAEDFYKACGAVLDEGIQQIQVRRASA
jgi:hypothetical protein